MKGAATRFVWFNLMPWPDMPDDFREKYRSVWVDIPSALYDPPIRVAEEFVMLDVIAGGRLVAGFPVGTSMDTNYANGRVPALLRERCAEAHELVHRASAEDEPFVFNGRYTKLRYANCWPKPVQSRIHRFSYPPASAGIQRSESRSGVLRNLEPNCGCGQRGCLRPSKRGSKPASGTA